MLQPNKLKGAPFSLFEAQRASQRYQLRGALARSGRLKPGFWSFQPTTRDSSYQFCGGKDGKMEKHTNFFSVFYSSFSEYAALYENTQEIIRQVEGIADHALSQGIDDRCNKN